MFSGSTEGRQREKAKFADRKLIIKIYCTGANRRLVVKALEFPQGQLWF